MIQKGGWFRLDTGGRVHLETGPALLLSASAGHAVSSQPGTRGDAAPQLHEAPQPVSHCTDAELEDGQHKSQASACRSYSYCFSNSPSLLSAAAPVVVHADTAAFAHFTWQDISCCVKAKQKLQSCSSEQIQFLDVPLTRPHQEYPVVCASHHGMAASTCWPSNCTWVYP